MRMALAALGIMVAAAVLVMLISPGLADEPEYICGMVEHTHTDECYLELTCGLPEGHEHDEGCWEAPLLCTMPTDHVHSLSCYTGGDLVCDIESGEEHVHGIECYEGLESICGIAPGHVHNETCYGDPVLNCTETGHIHTEACYTKSDEPQCGLPEHQHNESCLPQEEETGGGSIVMPKGELAEQAALAGEGECDCQYCQLGIAHSSAGMKEPTSEPTQPMARGGFMGIMPLGSGDDWDLANFLVLPIEICNLDGTPIDGAPTVGTDYIIKLRFEEEGSHQFANNIISGYMEYTLPIGADKFTIQRDFIDIPIKQEIDGREVGLFDVDKDTGLVTVRFYEMKADGTPTPGTPYFMNGLDTFFYLNLTARFTNIGENQEIDFGGGIKIDFDVQKKSAALELEKTADYDRLAETIDYTVTITAEEGPLDNITFTDYFKSNDLSGGNGAIGWDGRPGERGFLKNLKVIINGVAATPPYSLDTTEAPGTYSWDSAGNLTVHFDPDIILETGDTIVVTYTMDVGYLLENKIVNSTTSPYGNTEGRRYYYSFKINNKVNVTALDEESHELPASADTETQAQRYDVYKTGVLSTDGQTIHYVCYAGRDTLVKLNKMVITDTLGDGLTFGSGTAVTVRYYNSSNVEITPRPSALTATGTTFTYTVPDGHSGSDIYRVEFEYDATIIDTASSDPPTFDNTLKIDSYLDAKNPSTTIHTNNPNAILRMYKTGKFVGDYIEWTINWFIPGEFNGKPVYLRDQLSNAYGNVPYPGSFKIMVDDGSHTYQLDPELYEVVDFTYDAYNSIYESTSRPYYWFLFFKPYVIESNSTRIAQPKSGSVFPDPIPANGVTLTITYRTNLDETKYYNNANHAPTEQSIREWWEDTSRTSESYLENSASGFGTSDGGANWKPASNYVWMYYPVIKESTSKSSEIWYTVTIDKINGNGTRLDSWGDDPVFEDTFDSNIFEYIDFSFYVWTYGTGGVNSYGAYDIGVPGTDLLGANYITDNGNGTSTIRVPLKDLNKIRGPVYGSDSSYAEWIGPPGDWGVVAPDGMKELVTKLDWWVDRYGTNPIRVYYRLKIKDDIDPETINPDGPEIIHNTATLIGDDGEWSGNHDTSVNIYVVDKEMDKNTATGNTVDITIDINPLGLLLAQGKAPGSLIEIEDTMSTSLVAYLNSIEISAKIAPSTEYVVQTPGQWPEAWSYMVDGNKITFMVRDETPFKITYSALVRGAVGEHIPILNEVSVEGKFKDNAGFTFDVSEASAGAGMSQIPVTLTKTDMADSGMFLQGAEFALYGTTDFLGRPIGGSVPDTITISDTTFYFLEYGTTGADGKIVFSSIALFPKSKAVYALVEMAPPAGYSMPGDQITLFSFAEGVTGYAPRTVAWISDAVYIENTKISADAAIYGRKAVVGSSAPAGTDFVFTLAYSDASGVAKPWPSGLKVTVTGGDWDGDNKTITVTSTGAGAATIDFEIAIEGLAASSSVATQHYFTLVETIGGTAPGWLNATNEYLFRVNIPAGEETGTVNGYKIRANHGESWPSGSFTTSSVHGSVSGNPATFTNTFFTTGTPPKGAFTITGEKTVTGTGVPTGTAFEFTLTQVDSDGSAYSGVTPIAGLPLYAHVTTDDTGEKTYSFEFAEIGNLDDGTYYFKLEETNGSDTDWTYDSIAYIIKVVVKSGSTNVYYPNGTVDWGVSDGAAAAQKINIVPQNIISDSGNHYVSSGKNADSLCSHYTATEGTWISLLEYRGDNEGNDMFVNHIENDIGKLVVGAAYCIDHATLTTAGTPYAPFDDYDGFVSYYTTKGGQPGKILWVLRNGFMSEGVRDTTANGGNWLGSNNLGAVRSLVGNQALDADEAYCATQFAIWHFTDGINWTYNTNYSIGSWRIPDKTVWDAYVALVNAADAAASAGNIISELGIAVSLDSSTATLSGGWYGPVKIKVDLLPAGFTSLSNVPVTLTLVNGTALSIDGGATVYTSNFVSGDEFYVNVGSGPVDGSSVLVTAEAKMGSDPIKDVLILNNSGYWSTTQAFGGVGAIDRSGEVKATATLYYKAGGGNGLVFVNKYKVGGPEFPSVGGSGFSALAVAGFGLTALAGIALLIMRFCEPRFAFNTQAYSRHFVSRRGKRLTKQTERRGRHVKRE